MQGLDHCFSERTYSGLIILNSTLDLRERHESVFFRIDCICLLINNFYCKNSENYEKLLLKMKFHHFEHNILRQLILE